jgi:hypothetical protein
MIALFLLGLVAVGVKSSEVRQTVPEFIQSVGEGQGEQVCEKLGQGYENGSKLLGYKPKIWLLTAEALKMSGRSLEVRLS